MACTRSLVFLVLFVGALAAAARSGNNAKRSIPGIGKSVLMSVMKDFKVQLTKDLKKSEVELQEHDCRQEEVDDDKQTSYIKQYQVLDSLNQVKQAMMRQQASGHKEQLETVQNILGDLSSWTVQLSRDATHSKRSETKNVDEAADNDVTQKIIDYIDPQSISSFLRNLTWEPHVAGTPQDIIQARYIRDTWKSFGLDEVSMIPYEVLLSYPDENHIPNKVFILDAEGKRVYETSGVQPPMNSASPEEWSKLIFPNFNAYSAPGTVQRDLVYAYYGRDEDFKFLKSKGIDLEGKIVMARYGAIFRANIAKFAEDNGAKGLILFSDPKDFAQEGTKNSSVYPHKIWMPELAVQEGTTKWVDGDPITPLYPATESAYRIKVEDALIPNIPVQPIGYAEAEMFLSKMKGERAPEEWQGGLDVEYRLGPGLTENNTVQMKVLTKNAMRTTYNIIGTLKGEIEPDRYVLLGNHRDTWSMFGAIDPLSGTAILLELARVLTKINRETGWKPRRTIVFCSWAAEEYGLIGSTEWVEEHMNILDSRAVAYVNVDMALEGNASLRALGVPLLYDVLFDSAKKIPNPNPEEVAAGRKTVYDTWINTFPKDKSNVPNVRPVGSGSDHSPFIHYIGVPSADLCYTYVEDIPSHPLYHSLHETFYLMAVLYDEGFHYSAAVAGTWGEVVRALADTKILPFSVDTYGKYLVEKVELFKNTYGNMIEEEGISLDTFTSVAAKFSSAAEFFQTTTLTHVDLDNPYEVRRVNDLITFIERSFIDPRGLPERPDNRHVVFAPSSKNSYAGSSFAGLVDILYDIQNTEDTTELWEDFKRHLATVIYLIRSATNSLSESIHTRDEL